MKSPLENTVIWKDKTTVSNRLYWMKPDRFTLQNGSGVCKNPVENRDPWAQLRRKLRA